MPEKYRREIEEILDRVEAPPRRESAARRPRLGRLFGGRGWSVSPGRVMLGALSLGLVALLFRSGMPDMVGTAMTWGAVVLFILGYALFFINPGTLYEKRWRAHSVEDAIGGRWARLLSWLKGR